MLQYIKIFIISAVVMSGALLGGYFFIKFRAPAVPQTAVAPLTAPHQELGFHQSYFSQSEFFDKSFQTAALKPVMPDPSVSAVLVNHHLLAGSFIAETMGVVASDEPTTVILVSPNHFNVGSADIISSMYDWQTPYGVLPSEQNVIRKLQKQGVSVEELPFKQEHGISGVVPFIKKTMPNASIIPIMLKDKTSSKEIEDLTTALSASTTGRVIMVASVDFSHYLPSPVSDFHDVLSKHVLRSLNQSELLDQLEIDSRPSIRFLLQYADKRNTQKFTLLKHSNSSVVLKDFSITNGTSYITGYFSPGDRVKDDHKTIMITGAINSSPALVEILDKQKDSYIFSSSVRMFAGSDQTFLRVIGDDQDLISHLMRQGATDIESGTVISSDTHIAKPFTIIDMDATADFIPDAAGKVISIDWHGISSARQQAIARGLIDSGALIVVGKSAEILPVEQYGRGLIVYGLGEMIPSDLKLTVQSAAIGIDLDEKGISYSFFPMQYQQGKATFLKPSESGIVMTKLQLKQSEIKISY